MDDMSNTFVLDIVKEFECLGGDCPYTCCKGWQVIVDDKTLDVYHGAGKKDSLITYCAVKQKKNGTTVMRKICGRCPFYTLKGLCRFQLDKKMDYMPLVCRLYPRSSFVYGDIHEVGLELSCYHAAQLFVENPRAYKYEKTTQKYPVEWIAYDPDPDYVLFLKDMRDRILDYIWSDEDEFPRTVRHILEKAYSVHLKVALDDMDSARQIAFSDYEIKKKEEIGYAFFPIKILNEHIYGILEDTRIIFREPIIYMLMRRYKKFFGKLWEYEADEYFDNQISIMLAARPDLFDVVRAYFAYTIQSNLLAACDDYYLIRPVVMSVVMTQYLLIFLLTDYMDGKELGTDRQAAILSNMEKGIMHNPVVVDTILKSIRPDTESYIKQ